MSTTYGEDGGGGRHYSDKGFEWRPQRIYIPAWNFSGLDYEATGAADIKSMGTGTPSATELIMTEINTSGVTALNMIANATSIETFMMIPTDMDIQKNVYFRVWWTANNTSGSCTWDVLYKVYIPGTTILGTAVSATALSTAIGAQTMAGVAFTIMRTPEGILGGGTLLETTEGIQLGVVRTTATTITTASFLGLEIRYSPRRLRGPDGMSREAKAPATITSKQYI
jgi:hypothetical protein